MSAYGLTLPQTLAKSVQNCIPGYMVVIGIIVVSDSSSTQTASPAGARRSAARRSVCELRRAVGKQAAARLIRRVIFTPDADSKASLI